jgi:hypothetical protein
MRSIYFIFTLSTFLLSCGGKSKEVEKTIKSKSEINPISSDTLLISDFDLTLNPFHLGENPLLALREMEKSQSTFRTVDNKHVVNQVDTIFTLHFGVNIFELYKAPSKSILLRAKIFTNHFSTKKSLKIGNTKQLFMSKIQQYNVISVPDIAILKSSEGGETLEFIFNSDTIQQIHYCGSID